MIGNPFPLKQNEGKSFQGSIVLGKGFVLEPDDAKALIAKDPRYKEVLFPYLNGDDLNNDPEQKPSRWVINFFDWNEDKARKYPDCFEILERLVKPERQRWKMDEKGNEIVGTYALRKPLPQKWWIYGEKRPGLYESISKLDQVMVVPLVSKYSSFEFVSNDYVYMHKLGVLALSTFQHFGVLTSTIHNVWCWKNSSTLGAGTLNYSTTDCFETFPFPGIDYADELELISKQYYFLRKQLTREAHIGLTILQNAFHDSKLALVNPEDERLDDSAFRKRYGNGNLWIKKHLQNVNSIHYNTFVKKIEQLRSLQIEVDSMVLKTYKWIDIPLQHGFYELEYLPENDRIRFTIHPSARKEILKRLLLLNHQLHALEDATVPKKKIRNRPKNADRGDPLHLF